MIVFRYDIEQYSFKECQEMYDIICDTFPNEKVLAIPQEMDILFNCSTDDLYYLKEQIENAIHDHEVVNEN